MIARSVITLAVAAVLCGGLCGCNGGGSEGKSLNAGDTTDPNAGQVPGAQSKPGVQAGGGVQSSSAMKPVKPDGAQEVQFGAKAGGR